MSEAAAVSVVGEHEQNGIGPVVVTIPDEVRKNLDRGIGAMAPDQRKQAIAELEAMLAATREADQKANNAAPADAPKAPAYSPEEIARIEAEVAVKRKAVEDAVKQRAAEKSNAVPADPYPDPPHMVESREIAYLWSQEAIEKSAYLVTLDAWKRAHPTLSVDDFRYLVVGDMIKRFRPLDGYLLEADGGGDTGMPVVFKWLAQQPLLVAAASGKIVESKGPTNVVVHACHSLHKLIPLLQFDGVIHGRVRPMGWQTALSGEREWMFQLWVEPDEADPRKPKLISLESALGKSAR